MKKLHIILILVAVVAVVLFMSYGEGAEQGKVVFAITDAAMDMKDVNSINITVDQISVHSEAKGWVVISNANKEFDLLKLKETGALAFVAEANLAAGTYDQVRLNVSNIVVVKGGQTIEAKLPSSKLTLTSNLVINADTTSTITFDFLADRLKCTPFPRHSVSLDLYCI